MIKQASKCLVLELAVYMAKIRNLSKQNKSWHDID
jgi:hypothetical protein